MAEQQRITWKSVLAIVLWLVLAAGGLSLIEPVTQISSAIGLAMASGLPTTVTEDKYRVISARNFGLVAFGILWLVGMIFLQPWLSGSRTVKQLLLRSALVAVIEGAVWGIGALVLLLVTA